MVIVAFTIARTNDLVTVVILSSLYSFLMASVMFILDAADVAMTEASVGTGISTVLFLGTIHLVKKNKIQSTKNFFLPLLVSFVTAGLLIYGTFGLPEFGLATNPIHEHVAPKYLEDQLIPNIVTAVLASYRGFDTLGEVTVIFTAGIGIIALLKNSNKKRK